MQAQLSGLGIPFEAVPAIDAQEMTREALEAQFLKDGPLGELSKGDMACTLSHLKALQTFLDTGDTHAIVLEDDIVLSKDSAKWMTESSWIPAGADLVKLERFGPKGQRIVVSDHRSVGDRKLARLFSKHCGGAAYIVSRHAARLILDEANKPLPLPIDHLLFNPNNSPIFGQLSPWQLMPAICEQDQPSGGTDIHGWRKKEQPTGWKYIRRESLRSYYEFRTIPGLLLRLLTGRGHLQLITVQ